MADMADAAMGTEKTTTNASTGTAAVTTMTQLLRQMPAETLGHLRAPNAERPQDRMPAFADSAGTA